MDIKYGKEEILRALRELTKLSPIAQIKIKKAYYFIKKEAYKKAKYPVGYLNIDYTFANNLEIQLRMVALADTLTNLWKNYVSMGEYKSGLSDFVKDYLSTYLDNKHKDNNMKL